MAPRTSAAALMLDSHPAFVSLMDAMALSHLRNGKVISMSMPITMRSDAFTITHVHTAVNVVAIMSFTSSI